VIVAAIVAIWNQASLHIGQPWLTIILLGVFLVVAGLVGRGLRYLPQPASSPPTSATATQPAAQPRRKFRTGPPIPIPPVHVEVRTNGPDVFLAITNKDVEPTDMYVEAIELRGSFGANLPWRMVWIDGGQRTRSLKADETQIIVVGRWNPEEQRQFILHSPMGDLTLASFAEFTLRVRVHYDNDRTDYAISAMRQSQQLDDWKSYRVSGIEWDKR
jgi:hypothetical protein